MSAIVTTDIFIKRASIVHSNKYIYSKTNYTKSNNKVIITCPVHGDFVQEANSHLQGIGCRKCGIMQIKQKQRDTTEEFIQKAKAIHVEKYDYSEVDYINSQTKVTIICPSHGRFSQKANGHLNGKGCLDCKVEKLANIKRDTVEQFIEKANLVHKNKYDYSRVKYKNRFKKVLIGCPKHGLFKQIPGDHLNGHGCSKCKSSKGEQFIASILDKHNINYIHQYKLPIDKCRFSYDFCLPDYNLLIEFHGKQHFHPIKFFGGEERFNSQVLRDAIKREYAYAWKYRYLEIHYSFLTEITEKEFENRLLRCIMFGGNK